MASRTGSCPCRLRLIGIKTESDLIGHALGMPDKKLCSMRIQLQLSPRTHRLFSYFCTGAHFSAFLCALATGFRTSAAVLALMFPTFLRTGVTNCGAKVAEFRTELRILTHKCRTGPTEICAVYAKFGTLRHFIQALISVAFTLFCTAHVGIHTFLVLMGHKKFSLPEAVGQIHTEDME